MTTTTKPIRDARLSLPWFIMTTPSKAPLLVTTFDASRTNSGLGVAHGVQSYRDVQGRVGQVSRAYFEANSKRIRGDELLAKLPAMSDDFIQKRFFPESAQRLATEGKARAAAPSLVQRFKNKVRGQGKPKTNGPGVKNRKATGPAKLGPNVEIHMIRKARSESNQS